MLLSVHSVASFLLFGACVKGQPTWGSDNATAQIPPAFNPQNATAQALVYGYPLTQYLMIAAPAVYTFGINNFLHKRILSTAEDVAVVRPNEDTLYSSLVYDLSHGDVIINVPKVPEDQFYLMTYYDPYGNVLANVGSGYPDGTGQYCIRMRPKGTPNGIDTSTSTHQSFINSPSTYGVVLVRWALNSTNIDALHSYQNHTTSQNVSSTATAGSPYLLNLIQELQSHQNDTGSKPNAAVTIMGLLAAFAPFSPPLYEDQVYSVDNMLSVAGVSNGTYITPPSVDLGAANATAEEAIQNSLYQPGRMTSFMNGWSMVSIPYSPPDFGSDYAVRAIVARTVYLMLRSPNTTYPVWTNASAGENAGYNGMSGTVLNLGSREALIYDFVGGHPPLKSPGFWSLTMYDVDGFLVDNSQGTYRLGDRDNLTYSDGTLVYPDFERFEPDPEPFQILVQAADAAPPANWTSNWLPSPVGGGNFTVLMRLYETQDEVVSGEYVYPVVRKTAAITNETSSGTTSPVAHYSGSSSGAVKIGTNSQ